MREPLACPVRDPRRRRVAAPRVQAECGGVMSHPKTLEVNVKKRFSYLLTAGVLAASVLGTPAAFAEDANSNATDVPASDGAGAAASSVEASRDAVESEEAADSTSTSLPSTEQWDPTPVTVYRVYDSSTGEHLYTADLSEKDGLVKSGWKDEGVAWTTPTKSTKPVYRLFNPNNGGDHFYTVDKNEVDSLVADGWHNEGIAFYALPGAVNNDPTNGKRVYGYAVERSLNSEHSGAGTRLFTTSPNETNTIVWWGWTFEGVAWYVLGPGSANDPVWNPKGDVTCEDNAHYYRYNFESGWTYADAKSDAASKGYKNCNLNLQS